MYLESLRLTNFRSFAEQTIPLSKELTVFLPVATSATPMALPSLEKRPDPLDLTVEFPGGVRVHCRDEPSLIVVLRAARRIS